MDHGETEILWRNAYERALGPFQHWDHVEKRAPGRPDFLCIGAQKASTTWLYTNLQYHPLVWLPPVKELGFFNAIHLPANKAASLRHRRVQVSNARAWWATAEQDESKREKALNCINLIDSDRVDDDWYSQVFSFHEPDQMAGEITPEYSCLPREGVRHVLRFNPAMKVIVMVRDPADRALSHAKMLLGENLNRENLLELIKTDDFLTLRRYSDYAIWINRWRGLLPLGNVHLEGFAQVNADPLNVLRRICGFLGIPFHPDFFSAAGVPVFEGKKVEGEAEVRAILRNRMAETYDDLANVCGLTEVLDL